MQTSESETLPLETQLEVIIVQLDLMSGEWYGTSCLLTPCMNDKLDPCHKVVLFNVNYGRTWEKHKQIFF